MFLMTNYLAMSLHVSLEYTFRLLESESLGTVNVEVEQLMSEDLRTWHLALAVNMLLLSKPTIQSTGI